MSNPANLVRPPVINAPPAPAAHGQRNINLDELGPVIAQIAAEVVTRQVPALIQNALNPSSHLSNARDQTIDEAHINDITDLDKIPDVVKCLREFSGKPGEFNSWKKSVERILKIYEHTKGTPKYYGILNVIRNKIVGNADIALESYNTPLDWPAITKCLTLHYADKRDLSTLEYQMTALIQGKSTVQTFYQEVYSHLSLILNKLGCLEVSTESLQILTQTYRDKALDTFIRGLNGDLPKLLGIKEPADLPQALHLCLKLQNQNFRTNYANSQQQTGKKYYSNPTPTNNRSKQYFHPQLAYIPNHQNHSSSKPTQNTGQQNYHYPQKQPPPRPSAPKPPEPMDVDMSMRSKNIDYANRPRQEQLAEKRPPPSQKSVIPHKTQRTYHIDTEHDDNAPNDYEYGYTEEENDQTLDEYSENVDYEEPDYTDQPTEFSDIHFLE